MVYDWGTCFIKVIHENLSKDVKKLNILLLNVDKQAFFMYD